MYYSIMRAQRSLYIQEGRQNKGQKTAPPERVLGDSVMSGRHPRSVISGRPLFCHEDIRLPPRSVGKVAPAVTSTEMVARTRLS